MHRQIYPASMAILIMASAQASAAAGQFVYSDGEFDVAQWSQEILDQSGPQPSFSAQAESPGGNPGSYRQVDHHYGPQGGLTVGHWRNNATYDPAVNGAIDSVTVSFDLILLDGGVASLVVAYGLLATQDDTHFLTHYSLTTIAPITDVWVGHTWPNLTADQFVSLDGTHPDFSAGGSPVHFGFVSANSTNSGSRVSTASGIDNWTVTVFSAPTDSDGDGIADSSDNCIEAANADQRDTDGDSIGNICDPDVAIPNDCAVNFADLNIYKANFFATGDLDTDNNGDGSTNFADLNLVKSFFFGSPGPSAAGCN